VFVDREALLHVSADECLGKEVADLEIDVSPWPELRLHRPRNVYG